MKRTKTVLITSGVAGVIILAWVQIANFFDRTNPPPKGLVKQNEGFFPLYEKDFSKTVSVDKHPYLLRLFVYVEAPTPIVLNWEDVIFKLEAIKNGQVIGSHLIQGGPSDIFDSRHGLTNLYSVAISSPRERDNINNKKVPSNDHNNTNQVTTGKLSVCYFKFLEPCTYKLTVVQPCKVYEHTATELHIRMAY